MEKMERLTEVVPKFSDNAISTLVGWIIHARFKGKVTPEIEQKLKRTLAKGRDGNMKHALEVLRDQEYEMWREEGIEVGMEKGWKENQLKTAEAMKAKGIDVNTIAEITGLTVDDVLRL